MSFDLTADYFSLFGLPVSFSVDTSALALRYRELQQSVHPDKFANATEHERRLSLQYATYINEALRVLKSPIERGRYLLELKGVQWQDEQTTLSDPAFLMQQMELRESLDEVDSKPDPLDAVAEIIDEVDKLIRKNTATLEKLISSDDVDELHQARDQVRKMQFLHKMKQEAESLEARLEDER